jgi:hypothetical protein
MGEKSRRMELRLTEAEWARLNAVARAQGKSRSATLLLGLAALSDPGVPPLEPVRTEIPEPEQAVRTEGTGRLVCQGGCGYTTAIGQPGTRCPRCRRHRLAENAAVYTAG